MRTPEHIGLATEQLEYAMQSTEAFDRLTHLNVAAADLAKATAHYVYEARRNLMPWSRIGMALGMSKQAAQQKYGREALAGWNVQLPTA